MPSQKTEPPWEFLLSASKNSLQSYELSRLSHAANLRKEIGQLLDSWLDENSAAMLARWLMEQRELRLRVEDVPQASEAKPGDAPHSAHSVSDNVLADRTVPPPVTRGAP
jgi:hypothetical protein